MKMFAAKWGLPLILISFIAAALCVTASIVLSTQLTQHGGNHWLLLACLAPLILVAACGLFTIRGYSVAPGAIYIQRLLWCTRLPTSDLQSVTLQPDAMRWSMRKFGNGGLFSFTGYYWNRTLGAYRAFVTDPTRVVVLKFPERTVVLSPSMPEQFVDELANTTR